MTEPSKAYTQWQDHERRAGKLLPETEARGKPTKVTRITRAV